MPGEMFTGQQGLNNILLPRGLWGGLTPQKREQSQISFKYSISLFTKGKLTQAAIQESAQVDLGEDQITHTAQNLSLCRIELFELDSYPLS